MSKATAAPAAWTATLDDLRKVDGKAELVDGRLVRLSPAGTLHGFVVLEIASRLRAYAQAHGGHAFADNVGFVVDLPNRRSFSPDAAFCAHLTPTESFAEVAPTLAAEVRSPEDFGPRAEADLARKRSDYFAAGTQVVWDVDPLRERVVRAYRASTPDAPVVFHEDEEADAEPAVPGWRVRVADLMPPREEGAARARWTGPMGD
jgi:Uma2 family endonuclease